MNKRAKGKAIFGHQMTKAAQGALTSLVGMSLQRFGIPKKKVRNEDRLWLGIKMIYGLEPKAGEPFIDAVFRIRHIIKSMTVGERDACVLKVDRAAFHTAMDELLKGADKERLDDLKRPVTLLPARSGPKPSLDKKEAFYKSWEWRELRLKVIKEHGRECQCCGNRPGMLYGSGEPVRIVVDHIKPISKYWHLRLDRANLQVLCDECNQGKGNWDETDFRPADAPDEWIVSEDHDDITLTILDELNGGTIQ